MSVLVFCAGLFIGGAVSFVVVFDYFTKGPKP
jgi:hypothetical protein